MHDKTDDRFTALESIDADQLTAVSGGAGKDDSPPPPDDKKPRRKKGGGLLSFFADDAVELLTSPLRSEAWQRHQAYEPEARRSRLLRDAYSGGTGN